MFVKGKIVSALIDVFRTLSGSCLKKVSRKNIMPPVEASDLSYSRETIAAVRNRIILVTGAAGSIGTEIIRQLLPLAPGKLILIDHAETALDELTREIARNPIAPVTEPVLCDIGSYSRMNRVIDRYHPDIVFHAAGLKHVPLAEKNPAAAILTNVAGTKTLADLALHAGTGKFIFLSSEQANQPCNVMGATKRVAELYLRSLNLRGKTHFIIARLGNVMDSAGSVSQLFRAQIERGGPVTVTHPEATRLFLTLQRAARLLVETAGLSREVGLCTFQMGPPVSIAGLADRLIREYGLIPDKDIRIKFTGLRPGERLHEETYPFRILPVQSTHPEIVALEEEFTDYPLISSMIGELIRKAREGTDGELLHCLKLLISDYQYNNRIHAPAAAN